MNTNDPILTGVWHFIIFFNREVGGAHRPVAERPDL